MADTLQTFLDRVFPLPGTAVFGFICLVIAIYSRRVQVSGGRHFDRMFEPRQASLQPGPSAIDLVTRGTLGCVQAVIAFILFVAFLLVAVDAFVNGSVGLMRLVSGF